MATGLSFSSTQRTPTKKLDDLPVAPKNFNMQTTPKNIWNAVLQFNGHVPDMAFPKGDEGLTISSDVKFPNGFSGLGSMQEHSVNTF